MPIFCSVFFDQNEDIDKTATVIASEGISRALLKMEEIEQKLDSIEKNINAWFGQSIKELNTGLVALTSTENVFNVRLRIAKAKAIGKTKTIRKKIIDKAVLIWEVSRVYTIKQFHVLNSQYDTILKKYGLAGKSAPISSELSDFLGETGQAIEKLPFVYQRLFKIAPLEDKNFFEGHEREVIEINTAYNNWTKSRYAPTIIIGENGSGKSTRINLFLNELERQEYLKKQYFSSLNKFARDNISLALLFWLRSTVDVKKDTM